MVAKNLNIKMDKKITGQMILSRYSYRNDFNIHNK